jgi:uncharacterized protein with PIN domain
MSFARLVAGFLDRFDKQIERLIERLERRRVAAFVADERRQCRSCNSFAERVKRLGAVADASASVGAPTGTIMHS